MTASLDRAAAEPREIHVYPTIEEKPHALSGTECWCGPEVLDVDDGRVVVHQRAQ